MTSPSKTLTAEQVAKGLSETTKQDLLNPDQMWSLGSLLELAMSGCLYGDLQQDELTPLGIEVRNILRSQEQSNGIL